MVNWIRKGYPAQYNKIFGLSVPKNKKKIIESRKAINYWTLLGIPMNSSLKLIKAAYLVNYELIEETHMGYRVLVDDAILLEALIVLNNALATLSDPYLRYVHNCQINNEEPESIETYSVNTDNDNLGEDFGKIGNGELLSFVHDKMMWYWSYRHTSTSSICLKKLNELFKITGKNYDEISKKVHEQSATKLELKEGK